MKGEETGSTKKKKIPPATESKYDISRYVTPLYRIMTVFIKTFSINNLKGNLHR